MTKLDSKHSLSNISTASISTPKPARRLLVLVPSLKFDLSLVARKVWELANATESQVQFLGLYSDAAQESSLRRELVTLSAMVKDDRVSTEANTIFGKDWVEVVKTHFQPGDMVVCFTEQRAGSSNKLLSEVLQSSLNAPLYMLSGLYPRKDSYSNWKSQIAVWVGSILILIGFFILQVRINEIAKDGMNIILQILSISVELYMIWIWNSLFE